MTAPSHRIRFDRIIACALGISLLAGCGHSKKKTRLPQNPAPPAAVPARQNVPVDPALQDAARKEIFAAAGSTNALVRAHAMEAMRDAMKQEAAPYIVNSLTDGAPIVRFAASMAAG